MFRPWKALLLIGVGIAALSLFYFTNAVANTLRELEIVESARDKWQRPGEVLKALEAAPGQTIVDLGSGSGYFTLKLAPIVGERGRVVATDLRSLSLFFLSLRALQQRYRNIDIIRATALDPGLPANTAQSVLISNAFHEFLSQLETLKAVHLALKPAGRVVILDRAPGVHSIEYQVSSNDAVDLLRAAGFDVIRVEEELLRDPDGDVWWLVIAVKPPIFGSL